MADTITLTTNWGYNYWELGKPGRFPTTNIAERIPTWKLLKGKCPLPAIGLYTDQFTDRKFDYIIIKGVNAETDGNRQMFPCFIAKKGNTPMVGDKLVISVEALLYVLFKKIASGSEFRLDPIRNFFTNKRAFTIDNIKTYWD